MQRRLDPPAGVTARLAGLQVLGGAGQRRALLAAAAARDAAGRAARGRADAAARVPALGARVGAARADRAGDRLVGARAVRAARAAEPDVGDARRAGDRDLDRVLGAADRALPRGARGRARPAEALRRTYASTGAAVVASGATAIAGFAVLALSDVQMLSDFGRVTVVDLSVSLLGVLAVLPAVLMLAERRAPAPGAAGGARAAAGVIEEPRRPRMSQPGPPRPPRGDAPLHVDRRRAGRRWRSSTSRSTRSAPTRPGRAACPTATSCRRSRPRSPTRSSRATPRSTRSKACKVRGRDVLNSCELAARGPVVLAFFADALGPLRAPGRRARARAPALPRRRVRGDLGARRPRRRAAARARARLGLPVGYDHDGAVSNAYAVAVCPTITFARKGGVVADTLVRAAGRGGELVAKRGRGGAG